MEFVLGLGAPKAVSQQSIQRGGGSTQALPLTIIWFLSLISWCWWLGNTWWASLELEDEWLKRWGSRGRCRAGAGAGRDDPRGCCRHQDVAGLEQSRTIFQIFFSILQILSHQATSPETSTENSMHLSALFITENHKDALTVPFTLLPLAKYWHHFLSHSSNDNYKISPSKYFCFLKVHFPNI